MSVQMFVSLIGFVFGRVGGWVLRHRAWAAFVVFVSSFLMLNDMLAALDALGLILVAKVGHAILAMLPSAAITALLWYYVARQVRPEVQVDVQEIGAAFLAVGVTGVVSIFCPGTHLVKAFMLSLAPTPAPFQY